MKYALAFVAGYVIGDHLWLRREFGRLETFVIGSKVREWTQQHRPDVRTRPPATQNDFNANLRGEW